MIVLSAVNVVVPLFMKSLDVPLAEFVSPVARFASNASVPLFVKSPCVVIFAFIVNVPAFVTDPTVSTTPAVNVAPFAIVTASVSANVPSVFVPATVSNAPPVTFSPPVNVCAFEILSVPEPAFSTEPTPAIFPANVESLDRIILRLPVEPLVTVVSVTKLNVPAPVSDVVVIVLVAFVLFVKFP